MRFQTPLVPARLIRRYKRFLSDMELASGEVVVAHCPNPGSMLGMAAPGADCWLEGNDDPRRKLRWSWKLSALAGGGFVTVDTGLANRVVGEALAAGRVPGLAGYATVRPEVRFGKASRVDFLLTAPGRPDALVEVKSVTMRRNGPAAEFPDSRTARGLRHLEELARAAQEGRRAVMLYLIARSDCATVRFAADIDPAYARGVAAARAAGVELIAHRSEIGTEGIVIGPEAVVEGP